LFGSFLPSASYTFPLPSLPSLPGRIYSALISNFVGEKTKAIIRETKHFLLVEVRIVIHRDS
jgi:hypothetical protein